MKVLFLAPQPFYQERGTPIAVRLALESLTKEFPDVCIDLITYAEGEDIEIPRVKIIRIPTPRIFQGIRPGISFKKLVADSIFFWVVLKILWSSKKKPALIHAVEESVFMALTAKWIWGVPYIYDMDSSLSLQLIERWWFLKPVLPIFELAEKLAIRNSVAVAPVCDALEALAEKHGSINTVMLRDVSLVEERTNKISLRAQIGAKVASRILLYVGNLEGYQGIELCISSFGELRGKTSEAHLVIVGGRPEQIKKLALQATNLNIQDRVHLLGPRPVKELGGYLAEADILVSPRTQGNNTPMKIYSYMHSGKAILATRLGTHTQVLDDQIAVLAKPEITDFSAGMAKLIDNPDLCNELGARAKERATRLYTPEAFRAQLIVLYNKVFGT